MAKITHLVNSICVKDVQGVVSAMAAYCDNVRRVYRALCEVYLHTVHDTHALQVTICSHSTDDALHIFYADTVNQMCNFSQALTVAP